MNILRVDTSVRKEGSYSRKLTDKLISQLTSKHQASREGVEVVVRDLAEGISFIDENWSKANFTPVEDRTPEESEHLKVSDSLVEELNVADAIVIGLPIYNFNVPATFKAWIDLVVRARLTFQYTDSGPVGLLSDKTVYILVASGGTQLNTELDFISDYLRHIFRFIGITDIRFIDSSGIGKNESATLARAEHLIKQI